MKNFAPDFIGKQITSEEKLETLFRFRFNIFCKEYKFLNELDYPDGIEKDHNDVNAGHFATYNLADELVGYTRLVSSASGAFPFDRYNIQVHPDIFLPNSIYAREISRLALRPDLRKMEASWQIQLSLYREMYAYSIANNIRYWYASMERPLSRSLNRMGFGFKLLSGEVKSTRPLGVYIADLRDLETGLYAHNSELLTWMQA
jgi:N-acyl-L-homoserine lactone synthetase